VNIAFDATILGAGPVTGVGRSLLTTLHAYAAHHRGPLAILLSEAAGALRKELPSRAAVLPVATSFRQRQKIWPRLLLDWGCDLLHAPVAAIPLKARFATVATLHDLPWRHRATRRERGTRWRHRFAADLALDSARAVVVPSEATARDVVAWRPEAQAKIHVVAHGVAAVAAPADPDRRQGPLLVLGDDRPRKNRARVQRAHELARARHPELPDLRFVGPPDDWVDEAEKHRLLRTCRALLHFSLLEGYGLPVLEALAHGCPVACSPLPALEEIAGDAAVYAPPTDLGAMADAMVRVAHDDDLRRDLASRGAQRAALRTPAHTAASLHQLHAKLVDTARGSRP